MSVEKITISMDSLVLVGNGPKPDITPFFDGLKPSIGKLQYSTGVIYDNGMYQTFPGGRTSVTAKRAPAGSIVVKNWDWGFVIEHAEETPRKMFEESSFQSLTQKVDSALKAFSFKVV